ncbi:MAG: phosphotransferase [Alphaproteobacteria bacterium]|nr:phosphotransferase [Alphaproteobacteria bacterium]
MTEEKKRQAEEFLQQVGWGQEKAEKETLQADFSTRRFMRLRRLESSSAAPMPKTAILMQADPDQGTDSFVKLAALLRKLGLAAPLIYEQDLTKNLVLMEDFGDMPLGKALDSGANREVFDEKAVALLSQLHERFTPQDLGDMEALDFTAQVYAEQTAPFLDCYVPPVFEREASQAERQAFMDAWRKVLRPLDDALPRSLLLRDFMPDNVMLLKEPLYGQDLGLIDFQDAGLGSIAYDLASWVEQIRRDGGLERLQPMAELYHTRNSSLDLDTLLTAIRLYSAQRHTRILGRLVLLRRTDALPRVWNALQTLLHDDALTPVRQWFFQCKIPM